MGNGPVLRLKKGKRSYDQIIREALFLALKNLHAQRKISKYVLLFGDESENPLQFGNTPELLHFEGLLRYIEKEKLQHITVIYPDPPLGYEEVQLLNNVNKNIRFVTPLTL